MSCWRIMAKVIFYMVALVFFVACFDGPMAGEPARYGLIISALFAIAGGVA